MKKYFLLTMLVIPLLIACQDASPKHIEGQINSGDQIDGVVFQAIEEIDTNPEKEWPLILYLHGPDKVNSSAKVLKNDPPLNVLLNQEFFPFVVVVPKTSGEYERWAINEMTSLPRWLVLYNLLYP